MQKKWMKIEFLVSMFDKLKTNELNICVDFVIFITKKVLWLFLASDKPTYEWKKAILMTSERLWMSNFALKMLNFFWNSTDLNKENALRKRGQSPWDQYILNVFIPHHFFHSYLHYTKLTDFQVLAQHIYLAWTNL